MIIEKTIAISGHRIRKFLETIDVPDQLDIIFQRTYGEIVRLHEEGFDTFISGLTIGFDIIAAKAAIQARQQYPDIKLVAIVPSENHSVKWSNEEMEAYLSIIKQADATIAAAESNDPQSIKLCNDYLIDNAAGLLCYYTGLPGRTECILERAKNIGKFIINIAADENMHID